MGEAFRWIQDIVQFFIDLFPHPADVRPTYRGLLFKKGNQVKILDPGRHWYWPFWTEVEIIAVAQQPVNLQSQTVTTKDGIRIEVSFRLLMRVDDLIKAYANQIHDITDTISDTASAILTETTAGYSFSEILSDLDIGVHSEFLSELKEKCVDSLEQYGISILEVGLTDFAKTGALRLHGLPETEDDS